MENFDPKPNAVKEKSFYILHLDTPRIIILASVLIGIITAAFLFGMGFVKSDKPVSKELTVSDMDLGGAGNGDIFGKDIPPIPGDTAEEGSIPEDKIAAGDDAARDQAALPDESKAVTPPARDEIKHAKSDVLNENVKEIIPPAHKAKQIRTAKAEVKPHKETKKIAAKDAVKKNDNAGGKSRIYEVSRDVDTKKSYDSFSVQVASFDTAAKAEKEKDMLKSKRFDAYVARSMVGGRNYFRVRIGPVSSSKKAQELLAEVQRDSRYASSYMVRE